MVSQKMEIPDIQKLAAAVNKSDIASIKNVASGILKVVNDIHSKPKDLEAIIRLDPPLVAKILKVANSAYYSPPSEIDSVDRAVVMIGYDALKYIALGQKVRGIFSKRASAEGFSRSDLWKHCVAVGVMGRVLYNHIHGEGGTNLYTAGLIHDIGIIAIEQFLPDAFQAIFQTAAENGVDLNQVEKKILGFNHAELAVQIIAGWKLPQELVSAIGAHHTKAEDGWKKSETSAILYLADAICRQQEIGFSETAMPDEASIQACSESIGFSRETVDLLTTELHQEIAKIEGQGIF